MDLRTICVYNNTSYAICIKAKYERIDRIEKIEKIEKTDKTDVPFVKSAIKNVPNSDEISSKNLHPPTMAKPDLNQEISIKNLKMVNHKNISSFDDNKEAVLTDVVDNHFEDNNYIIAQPRQTIEVFTKGITFLTIIVFVQLRTGRLFEHFICENFLMLENYLVVDINKESLKPQVSNGLNTDYINILSSIGLSQYVSIFKENGWTDVKHWANITDEMLIEMQFKDGHIHQFHDFQNNIQFPTENISVSVKKEKGRFSMNDNPLNSNENALALENPLSKEMLAKVEPSKRKDLIGSKLYPKIQLVEPRWAGKITGMLLELDNSELLVLLFDDVSLLDKINEALAVLKNHHIKMDSQRNPEVIKGEGVVNQNETLYI